MIVNNPDTSLSTTVNKAHGNLNRAILERFIKPRSSSIFGHPVYSMDGPGPQIAVSVPYEDFQKLFLDMDKQKILFIWNLQDN